MAARQSCPLSNPEAKGGVRSPGIYLQSALPSRGGDAAHTPACQERAHPNAVYFTTRGFAAHSIPALFTLCSAPAVASHRVTCSSRLCRYNSLSIRDIAKIIHSMNPK